MKKIQTIKMASGFVIATLLASNFHLHYATSAGIVALLSIQNTKKETIHLANLRLLSFFLSLLIIIIVFSIIGINVISFGIFLLLFVHFSYKLNIQDGIAMNSVISTHYLIDKSISYANIKNELCIFLIGYIIGIILNLYMPTLNKNIQVRYKHIETNMKNILYLMSGCILKNEKTGILYQQIDELEQYLLVTKTLVIQEINNHLLEDTDYQLSYIEMRKNQLYILKCIYDQMMLMDFIPHQSNEISILLLEISNHFNQDNLAKKQLDKLLALKNKYKNDELPKSRLEFENRSHLLQILYLIHQFLLIKFEFELHDY